MTDDFGPRIPTADETRAEMEELFRPDKGFMLLPRGILESGFVAQDPAVLSVWFYCMIHAAYRGRRDMGPRNEPIHLRCGQLVATGRSISEFTGLTQKRVQRALARLAHARIIKTESGNRRTLITMRYYSQLQTIREFNGQSEDEHRANRGHTDNRNTTESRRVPAPNGSNGNNNSNIINLKRQENENARRQGAAPLRNPLPQKEGSIESRWRVPARQRMSLADFKLKLTEVFGGDRLQEEWTTKESTFDAFTKDYYPREIQEAVDFFRTEARPQAVKSMTAYLSRLLLEIQDRNLNDPNSADEPFDGDRYAIFAIGSASERPSRSRKRRGNGEKHNGRS